MSGRPWRVEAVDRKTQSETCNSEGSKKSVARQIFKNSRSGRGGDQLSHRPSLLQGASLPSSEQPRRERVVKPEVEGPPRPDTQHRHVEPPVYPSNALKTQQNRSDGVVKVARGQ